MAAVIARRDPLISLNHCCLFLPHNSLSGTDPVCAGVYLPPSSAPWMPWQQPSSASLSPAWHSSPPWHLCWEQLARWVHGSWQGHGCGLCLHLKTARGL